ncbi:MAG: hypothetical protein JSU98_07440, partial [Gemmatimonadales bacterium]
ALYWKGTTRAGVAAGMGVGTLVLVVWELTPVLQESLYGLIPAFLLSTVAVVLVSLAPAGR